MFERSRSGNRGRLPYLAPALLILGGLAVTAGCVDEKVVFEERPIVTQPPSGAGNFLGYDVAEDKLTVCGNCHVGKQAAWETTAHASAWEGLQSSGHAQGFCEGCHTVNERGNTSEGELGWTASGDPRYHDVQCESCHGPGLQHVENPDASQPLANVSIPLPLGEAEYGCGECHSGAHHPFVDQWALSAHGQVPNQGTPLNVGPFCLPCHEGNSALANQFGETSNYVEKGGDPMPITCAVCHDPHPEGAGFAKQLRAPINEPSMEHLCVQCHSNRGTPPSTHGPHGYQGLLVLGQNVGWLPPDFDYPGEIVSTHGSDRNPGLCATCHVSAFEVTDEASGEFLFQSVGHTFNAIPCTDENGVPTGQTDCELSARTFEACSGPGGASCHSPSAARGAFFTLRTELEQLLDQLWFDNDGDHVIEPSDDGLLPQVVALGDTSALNPSDDFVSVAEGAMWNAQMAWTSTRPFWGSGEVFGIHFSSHKGSGEGVHNPFLLKALLIESIRAVKNRYGLSGSGSINAAEYLDNPPPGVSLQ